MRTENEPYINKWTLVGGAFYNNEYLEDGVKREIFEKSGIEDVALYQYGVFDEKEKTPTINMRMIAIDYLGLVDSSKIEIIKENLNTKDVCFIDIKNVPKLAFSHNEMLDKALEKLRELIVRSDILKVLLSKEFSIK